MPRIYHDANPLKLKTILEKYYSITFGFELNEEKLTVFDIIKLSEHMGHLKKIIKYNQQIQDDDTSNEEKNNIEDIIAKATQAQKHKLSEIRNSTNEYNETYISDTEKELSELLQKAQSICNNMLPADCKNFLSVPENENLKNFLNRNKNTYDLLSYVITDAFMNLDKFFFDNSPEATKYFDNIGSFVENCEFIPDVGNYLKLYDLTYSDFLLNNDFKLESRYDYERDYSTTDIPVYKYLYKTFGLLSNKIKMNPYHNLSTDSEESEFKTIYMPNLKTYFLERMYDLIRADDAYKTSDSARYLLGLYYLDQLYDFRNMIYIANKITHLWHQNFYIHQYKKSDLSELLYQCILIPDIFSKKYYIDNVFLCLACEDEVSSTYIDDINSKGVIAYVCESSSDRETRIKNLEKCTEYLSYISKIYLPVISACFYILLFDKYNDIETIYTKIKCIMLKKQMSIILIILTI